MVYIGILQNIIHITHFNINESLCVCAHVHTHKHTHMHYVSCLQEDLKKKFPRIILHLNTRKLNFSKSAKNALLIVVCVLSLNVLQGRKYDI